MPTSAIYMRNAADTAGVAYFVDGGSDNTLFNTTVKQLNLLLLVMAVLCMAVLPLMAILQQQTF